jgi:nucleotide-binding universal stress UspA family protein
MYKTILLTLDGTPTDRAIIEHVKPLAKLAQSRVVLLHVADGWAARTYGRMPSARDHEDTAYLKKFARSFNPPGFRSRRNWPSANLSTRLSNGWSRKGCDLVAMSTHGHRFLADIFLGTTASRVQHSIRVPVLCCGRSNGIRCPLLRQIF